MRKSILLVEYFRLREMNEGLEYHCPVCEKSEKLKRRFTAEKCPANAYMTACHPTIQERCSNISKTADRLMEMLDEAIEETRWNLIDKFKATNNELEKLYIKWRTKRREDHD